MPECELLKALKRWRVPTVERYRQHLEACESLGVEPDAFERFAEEVLNTPERSRDWLLKSEPLENYEPFIRFAQYDTPIVEEMTLGLSGRKR